MYTVDDKTVVLTAEVVTLLAENRQHFGRLLAQRENNASASASAYLDDSFRPDPVKTEDLLRMHFLLLGKDDEEAGKYRSKGNMIYDNGRPVKAIPRGDRIPAFMEQLIRNYELDEAHPLLKSIDFYFQMELIQPFAKATGRCGRIWMMLLLERWNSVFGLLSIEDMIAPRREEFDKMLVQCIRTGDCCALTHFVLEQTAEELKKLADQASENKKVVTSEMKRLKAAMQFGSEYTTHEMMELVHLRHRPTFRDNYLLPCMREGYIEMTIPDKPNSRNQRYRLAESKEAT